MSNRETGIRGSVLLYVVWAVVLLSVFAVSVGSQTLFALGVTERLSEQLRAAYIARGAAQYALLALDLDDSKTVDSALDAWADNPGLFQHHALGGGTFDIVVPGKTDQQTRYGLTDEDRRINLNTAPAGVLQRLFERAGMREDEALSAAASIEDWRDEDHIEHSHGAEGMYYRSLSDAYDCKNGPFENVEELLLIRSMRPEIYRKVEPSLTVYGSGRLNLNTASPAALDALGLSDIGVKGMLAFRAGEDGLEGTSDDRRLVSTAALDAELRSFVPVEDLARLAPLEKEDFLGVGSDDFRMDIQAETPHRASQVQLSCVIDRKGRVRHWSER